MKIDNYFEGKIVFITGGSSGIGLAVANILAGEGCNLVLFARGEKRLEGVCDFLLKKTGTSKIIEYLPMDVSDNDDVIKKIGEAVEKYGTPDILINSAGVGIGDYFENIDYDAFDRTMKINVYGTRNTTSAVLPFMKQKGSGQVVVVSSVAGLVGMYGYSAYGASKYALVGLAEAMRSELRRDKIAVTLFCPPEVRTPLIAEEAKTLPPEVRFVKSLAGLLEPDEAAKALVKAIRKKRFLTIPSFSAKFIYFNHRYTNGHLSRFLSDIIISVMVRIGRRKDK